MRLLLYPAFSLTRTRRKKAVASLVYDTTSALPSSTDALAAMLGTTQWSRSYLPTIVDTR